MSPSSTPPPAPASPPTRRFVVFSPEGPRTLDAEAILILCEEGMLSFDTPVMLEGGTRKAPLRNWLREMVFIADEENRAVHGSMSSYRSLFEVAFDDAPIGMVLSDLSGVIVRVNQAMADFLGMSRDAIVGRSVGSLSPPGSREEEVRLGNALIAGRIRSFQVEKQFLHASGEALDAIVGLSILRSTDSRPARVIAHVTDIREQKRLEKHAVTAERIEAISDFAGAIAHDFNNLLTSIGSNISLARESEEEIVESLDGIEAAVGASERLVMQLQTLHGAAARTATPVDVVELLDSILPALRGLVPPHVVIQQEFARQPARVSINPSQFEQIVMNLVVNAGHASGDEGAFILLRTQVIESPNDEETVENADPPNTSFVLDVIDNGSGMDPDTQSRIFDPFFTTRRGSGGSGLGLATVATILKRNLGGITVTSTPGEGSAFQVTLPMVTHDATDGANAAPLPPPDPTQHLKGTRILVVDDQAGILHIIRRILVRHGCKVTTCQTCQEAASVLASSSRFDLILSDIFLGDGHGDDIRRLATAHAPESAFVFMSGVQTRAHSREEDRDAPLFIRKPFSPSALCEMLSRAMVDNT